MSSINKLKKIEKRLLEIEEEKQRRLYNLKEDYSGSYNDDIEAEDIKYLDIEKGQLQLERQFILDSRNGWKSRMFWNVAVPVLVTITTLYIKYRLDINNLSF